MVKKDFHRKRIFKWKEIHKYKKKWWIYRGQEDAGWRLKTTLERTCENNDWDPKEAKDIEERLLREFKRKYYHYSMHSPKSRDSLEWLSLMQHYGAPTRLLDFTYSIYVAAYFAVENATNDCAVWAINGKWAVGKCKAFFKKGSVEREFLEGLITEKNHWLLIRFSEEMILRHSHVPRIPLELTSG